MVRFRQWYDVQPFAVPADVEGWTSVPNNLKTANLGWTNQWAADEQRLATNNPPFASDDELGRFIEEGIHNQFLHSATAQAFNEPQVRTFHSPESTLFYKIHGLVQHWWNICAFPIWSWDNLGKPTGVNVSGPMSVVTMMDTPTSGQRPHVFVQGSDGNLWCDWWG
jgi:hypothetical protein